VTSKLISALRQMATRRPDPVAWVDGGDLPWNDIEIGRLFLAEHLDQSHDSASRPRGRIATEVRWLAKQFKRVGAKKILDLTCGPGFYALGLAEQGYSVVGIDYNPASIQYAQEHSSNTALSVAFILGDIRGVDFGQGFDGAIFIYGQPNAFRREDLQKILAKLHSALNSRGLLILEFDPYYQIPKRYASSWKVCDRSCFCDQPHLFLEETFWHKESSSRLDRYYVLNLQTEQLKTYTLSETAYRDAEVKALLEDLGFRGIRFYGGLAGEWHHRFSDWLVAVAKKK
jgi:SAM-dependent methyltransferase